MAKGHSEGFIKLVEDAKRRVREVSVEEVRAAQDRGDALHLVDVREDNEWAIDRARGAIHIGKGVLERDVEGLIPDKQARIVLYCGGGFRSALAADNLQRMGYVNVLSMAGGIRAWREKQYPLEGAGAD
jgi:rhodanese-related sulfurtransferase